MRFVPLLAGLWWRALVADLHALDVDVDGLDGKLGGVLEEKRLAQGG